MPERLLDPFLALIPRAGHVRVSGLTVRLTGASGVLSAGALSAFYRHALPPLPRGVYLDYV